jgi:predicted ATPase with chaperone activity
MASAAPTAAGSRAPAAIGPRPAEQSAPLAPASIEETGLTSAFVADLTLKLLYQRATSAAELVQVMCLPLKILQPVLDFCKTEHLVEVKGGAGVTASTYVYVITEKGATRAKEAMARNAYVGAAPVPLAAYVTRVRAQSLGSVQISFDLLRKALGHLVLPDLTLRQLGPAINSAQSIFLFGPPGTGKSTISKALATMLTGSIVVPYAILVGQQIIRVYDPSRHRPLVELDAGFERPWG